MDTTFWVNVQIQLNTLSDQVTQWVSDCAGLGLVSGENTALLWIWDIQTFLYQKQLGVALPKHVVVIAEPDAELEKQVLLSGVTDYISSASDFNIIALRLSLHVQNLQYLNRLENLSVTDTLTGLFNRRKFNDEMDACWRQSIRSQMPCSLLMLDVDHFKVFNDTYGHIAGDQCLQELANVFRIEAVRPYDTAARIGGEEFAVILPDTDSQGAMHVANRIIQRVTSLNIVNEHTVLGHISISVGLACVTPRAGDKLEAWVQEADDALYFAKESGRNQVKTEVAYENVQETLIF